MHVTRVANLAYLLVIVYAASATHTCEYDDSTEMLNCNGRNLTKIPSIDHELNVKVLILSNNRLGDLDDGDLDQYGNVSSIQANINDVGTIAKYTFNKLVALYNLDLSHNRIRRLDVETFVKNRKLESLNLQDNQLRKWLAETPGFLRSDSLSTLDLRCTGLVTIDAGAFKNLSALQSLDLADNSLSGLSPELVDNLQRLQNVKLKNNPWRCEGSEYMLQKLGDKIKDRQGMTCTDEKGSLRGVDEEVVMVTYEVPVREQRIPDPETVTQPSSSPKSSITIGHVLLVFFISYGVSQLLFEYL